MLRRACYVKESQAIIAVLGGRELPWNPQPNWEILNNVVKAGATRYCDKMTQMGMDKETKLIHGMAAGRGRQ